MKTMKNIVPMIVAGVIGGLFTLGSLYLLQGNMEHSAVDKAATAQNVNFRSPTSVAPTIDFKAAAASTQKSVVRIAAAESETAAIQRLQNQRRNNPFELLFGFGGYNSRPQIQKGTGSGVIVSADGYIITNNHVIDFADEIEVTLTDDRSYSASVVGTDPMTDLAVLKIDGNNLPAITLGDSDEIQVGEWVLAVGNPYDYLESTVTAGIVSAKGRDLNTSRNKRTVENFIQTDAVVNPGNSGGALVDVDGNLIGINTMIYTRTGSYIGYSFAVPVNTMKEVYRDIKANGGTSRSYAQQQSPTPNNFEPRQPRGPRLGISIKELDEETVNQIGLNFDQGLLIEDVSSNSNAFNAGLLENDIIVKVNDTRIRNGSDIIDLLDRSRRGDVLQVKVYRDGIFKTIPVRLNS